VRYTTKKDKNFGRGLFGEKMREEDIPHSFRHCQFENERRELNYVAYRGFMKNDLLRVKIREGEPEDKPKQRIKK